MPAKRKSPEKGKMQMKLERLIRDLRDENALLQSEVERQQQVIEQKDDETEKQESELDNLKQAIAQKDVETQKQDTELHKLNDVIAQKDIEITNLELAESVHTDYVEKMKQSFNDEIADVKEESQQLKKMLEETVGERDAAREQQKKQERKVSELEKQYKSLKLQHITKDESSDDEELESSNNFGHTTTASKVVLPIPQIEKFDGSNWEGFVSQFDSIAEFYHLDEKTKLHQLLHRVAGEAKQFVFLKCDMTTRSTYQSLTNALKQRFGSDDNHANFRAQLDALRLGQKDSMAEFSSEVAYLVRKAWPNVDEQTRKEMEVEYFVKNLTDPVMVRTVGNQSPASLEEARQLAENYLRLEEQLKPRRNAIRKVTLEEATPDNNQEYITEQRLNEFGNAIVYQIESRLDKLTKALQMGNQDPRVCFNCNRPGHLARNCPQRMRQGRSPSPRRQGFRHGQQRQPSRNGIYSSPDQNSAPSPQDQGDDIHQAVSNHDQGN